MDLDQQVPVVILLPVNDARLETYREALFKRIDAPDVYEQLSDLHITIHPGFKTTPHGIETIRTFLAGRETTPDVTATTVYAYPSSEDPAIIAVSVRAHLSPLREKIQYILNGYEHTIINKPKPAHLTLLKRRDIDDNEVSDDVYERVRNAIDDITPPSALQFGDPRVELYNPPYRLDNG